MGASTPESKDIPNMPGWVKAAIAIVLPLGLLASVIGPIVWGRAEKWDTPTALGAAGVDLAGIGLAIAVGGFTVAILQIRKAASAARAARQAIERTLRGVAAIELIGMIERLSNAAAELQGALADDDSPGCLRALRTWQTLGSDAKGPIERHFGADYPALESLDKALEASLATMRELREGGAVKDVVPGCLEALERASGQLGPLRNRLLPTMAELDEQP
jgi:hypothetical protein